MNKRIEVDADALRKILVALNGPPHYIREIQALRSFPDNPITTLIGEYNAWVEKQTQEGSPHD